MFVILCDIHDREDGSVSNQFLSLARNKEKAEEFVKRYNDLFENFSSILEEAQKFQIESFKKDNKDWHKLSSKQYDKVMSKYYQLREAYIEEQSEKLFNENLFNNNYSKYIKDCLTNPYIKAVELY